MDIQLFLTITSTLLSLVIFIPVIFRGRMNSNTELAFLMAGLLQAVFAFGILIIQTPPIIASAIGSFLLWCSPQGRALIVEFCVLPLELAHSTERRIRNLFLEEKKKYNYQYFRSLKDWWFSVLSATPNLQMGD